MNSIAKINASSEDLSDEQKTAIQSLNGIEVQSTYKVPGTRDTDKYFMLTTRFASTDSLDTLIAAIVHDAHHADQKRRGVDMYGIEPEKQASCSALPILKIMKLGQSTIESYEYDCLHGHGEWGPGPKIKPKKERKKEEEQ